MSANAELGLFRETAPRYLARDNRGRFVSLKRSGHRRVVLERARQLRAELGLPAAPILDVKDAA